MLSLLYAFGFLCLNSYVAVTVCEFYHLYTAYALRQKEGLWLYMQCQEPEFSQKLSLHSDACLQIHALFQKSPWTFALDEFLRAKWSPLLTMMWDARAWIWIVISTLLFFIMIPPYLSFMERRERNRLTLAITQDPLPQTNRHCNHDLNHSMRRRTLLNPV